MLFLLIVSLFFGKEKKLDKGIRNYKKRINELVKGLKRSKGNYKTAKYFINPLRREGEDLLRREALIILIRRKDKYLSFYQSIERSELIAEEVKQNNLIGEDLKNFLNKNAEKLSSNDMLIKNLKDLVPGTSFSFKEALKTGCRHNRQNCQQVLYRSLFDKSIFQLSGHPFFLKLK